MVATFVVAIWSMKFKLEPKCEEFWGLKFGEKKEKKMVRSCRGDVRGRTYTHWA